MQIAKPMLRLRWPAPMRPSRPYVGGALVGAVVLALVLVQSSPSPSQMNNPAPTDGVREAAAALRADGFRADFAQDYVGAGALVARDDPYPALGPAFAKVGLIWPVPASSTHPPTAFLAALPVAAFRWPVAYAVWAWLMIATLVIVLWALGAGGPRALAFGPLLLLWPPIAWSIGQLTLILLLTLCLAWRWRDRPICAGAVIGVAAVVKLVPALLLVPLILRRRWGALAGFAAVTAGAILAVAALDPRALSDYLTAGREASRATIARSDNGALLPWLGHVHGWPAAIAGAVFVVLVVARRPFSWAHWSWATVALLPIAWVYSLAVLGPVLVATARSKQLLVGALALLAIAYSTIAPPYGDTAAHYQAAIVALTGLALLAARRDLNLDLTAAESPVAVAETDI